MSPQSGMEALLRNLHALRSALGASRWTDAIAAVGILSLAFPLGYLVGSDVRLLGVDPSALHKLLVIACTLVLFVSGGLRHWLNPVIVATTLVLLIGFVASSRLPALSPMQSLQSYGTFILGAYILELRLGTRIVRWLVTAMPWVAVANLCAAVALWFLDGRLFYRWYFGAFRLQGIGNPAMLSAMALGALMFSLLASLRRPVWVWLAALNFLIIVWTGTRTRTVEGAFLLLGWVIVLGVSTLRDGRRVPRTQTAVLILSVPLALLSYTPHISERLGGFVDNAANETIAVSIPRVGSGQDGDRADEIGDDDVWTLSLTATGRMAAWSFYWDLFRERPWFGGGLGASIVAGDGILHPVFEQPHNEYLRILVDGGSVGLLLMATGYFLILLRFLRHAGSSSRRWLVLVAFGLLSGGAFVQSELTSLGFNLPFWLFVGILAGELPVAAGTGDIGATSRT